MSRNPTHSIYAGANEASIVDRLQDLVCAINRARKGNKGADQHFTDLIEIPGFMSHKRYTAIAQATLICERKKEKIHVQKGLSDGDLSDTLKKRLNCQGESLDAISDELQARLREDRVRGLPALFSEVQHYHSRTEQVRVAIKSLSYLKDEGIITEIGDCEDGRLQNCAQACARLCYSSGFELPHNLNDATLPDLAVKLAIMQAGRANPVDGQKHMLS